MGLSRRSIADPRVTPAPVIEDFEILEQCRFGLPAGAKPCEVNQLGLERAEERLHGRVIVTVAFAAHGRLKAVTIEDLAVGAAGVLHAAIGMMDETSARGMMLNGHHQRLLAQGALQVIGHAPADDLAGGYVLDGSQVQPALVGRNVGHVSQPDGVRTVGLEGALEEVRGDAVAVPAVGRDRGARLAPERPNTVVLHEPGDALAGGTDALGAEFSMDARCPIASAAFSENTSDLANKVGLGTGSRGPCRLGSPPLMKPAARYTQDRAQASNRIAGRVGGDEGELRVHAFSAHLAKKAPIWRKKPKPFAGSRFPPAAACSRGAAAAVPPLPPCAARPPRRIRQPAVPSARSSTAARPRQGLVRRC